MMDEFHNTLQIDFFIFNYAKLGYSYVEYGRLLSNGL